MFRVSEYCFRHGCSNTAWAELMKPLRWAPDAFLNSSFSFLQWQFDCICFSRSSLREKGEKNEHRTSTALTWVLQADNTFNMLVIMAFAINCSTISADCCLQIAKAEAHIACCFDKLTARLMLICIVEDCCDQFNQRTGADVQQLLSCRRNHIHNAGLDLTHIWEAEEPNSLMTCTISCQSQSHFPPE